MTSGDAFGGTVCVTVLGRSAVIFLVQTFNVKAIGTILALTALSSTVPPSFIDLMSIQSAEHSAFAMAGTASDDALNTNSTCRICGERRTEFLLIFVG